MNIDIEQIEKVEAFKGYPGERIEMKDGFEELLLIDLNRAVSKGPTKFGKTHRIMLHYKDGSINTIRTNGNVHAYKGCFTNSENLIEKYVR